MVKAVAGFQASDGQIFDNEVAAYVQELRLAVLQITGGNIGLTDSFIAQRATLFPLMKALINKEAQVDDQG